jgi:hypothetical protein
LAGDDSSAEPFRCSVIGVTELTIASAISSSTANTSFTSRSNTSAHCITSSDVVLRRAVTRSRFPTRSTVPSSTRRASTLAVDAVSLRRFTNQLERLWAPLCGRQLANE